MAQLSMRARTADMHARLDSRFYLPLYQVLRFSCPRCKLRDTQSSSRREIMPSRVHWLPSCSDIRVSMERFPLNSIRERYGVGAHLAACRIDAFVALSPVLNAFVASEAALADAHRPAQVDEGFARICRHAGFEAKHSARAQVGQIFAHGLRRAFMMPTRTVGCCLHVETIVDAIDDDLRLSLRLHIAAHYAKRQPGHTVSRSESGNDGLEGPLARRVEIRMSILQREELAAILKHKTESDGH